MEQVTANSEIELKGKPVTLFDVDNTLVRGFTIFPFVNHLANQGLVKPETAQTMKMDLDRYTERKITYQVFAIEVVNHYCEGLTGSRQIDVSKVGNEYLESYLDQLLPYTEALVRLMNRHGITIAVSGAPEEAFVPLAKRLGIAQSYLLEAEVTDGHYTGRVKTNMALKQEKDKVINTLINSGFSRDLSFAFGDSTSDLPILEAVSNQFAVEPSEELRKIALEKGWPIVTESNIIEKVGKRIQELKGESLL